MSVNKGIDFKFKIEFRGCSKTTFTKRRGVGTSPKMSQLFVNVYKVENVNGGE